MLSIVVRTVVAPDGRTWKVRRKWLTRTVHWRGPWRPTDALDALGVASDLSDIAELPVVGWILVVPLLLLFGAGVVALVVPAVLFLGELAVVLLLVGLGVLGRILFRRPWTVEARLAGTNEGRQWKVAGWRASGEQVAAVAERLQATGRVGDVTWTPTPTD
jgi:hypothetical protein